MGHMNKFLTCFFGFFHKIYHKNWHFFHKKGPKFGPGRYILKKDCKKAPRRNFACFTNKNLDIENYHNPIWGEKSLSGTILILTY